MYTVYILKSEFLSRYYVGFTGNDVELRLKQHLADHKGFTAKVKDWKLVYTEVFANKAEAMQREREIKGWKSSKSIERLIGSSIE
jgi:putative endonuclease